MNAPYYRQLNNWMNSMIVYVYDGCLVGILNKILKSANFSSPS